MPSEALRYLSAADVALIHRDTLEHEGGIEGVRDMGLLDSAVATPRQKLYGIELHRGLAAKAEGYLVEGVSCGAYANRCRSRYRDGDGGVSVRPTSSEDRDGLPKSRASWARLLRMVFTVDPLTCRRCGAEMKVISVITDPVLIDKLLRHVRQPKAGESAGEDDSYDSRAPPAA